MEKCKMCDLVNKKNCDKKHFSLLHTLSFKSKVLQFERKVDLRQFSATCNFLASFQYDNDCIIYFIYKNNFQNVREAEGNSKNPVKAILS